MQAGPQTRYVGCNDVVAGCCRRFSCCSSAVGDGDDGDGEDVFVDFEKEARDSFGESDGASVPSAVATSMAAQLVVVTVERVAVAVSLLLLSCFCSCCCC